MPLYEYECTACHRHTEKIQKFSDPEITICPHCGGALQRVISAPAIAFKGGGWYKDGYGNAAPKTSAATPEGTSSAAAAPSGAESSAAKSESAPAAAPAAAPASTPAAAPAASK